MINKWRNPKWSLWHYHEPGLVLCRTALKKGVKQDPHDPNAAIGAFWLISNSRTTRKSSTVSLRTQQPPEKHSRLTLTARAGVVSSWNGKLERPHHDVNRVASFGLLFPPYFLRNKNEETWRALKLSPH